MADKKWLEPKSRTPLAKIPKRKKQIHLAVDGPESVKQPNRSHQAVTTATAANPTAKTKQKLNNYLHLIPLVIAVM